MKAFHCRICGHNIGREGNEHVFGDGVCDDCQLKQPGLCEECAKEGRVVKVADCAFHGGE